MVFGSFKDVFEGFASCRELSADFTWAPRIRYGHAHKRKFSGKREHCSEPKRAMHGKLTFAAARFKGYRLCRRPLQRLMIAGLKQLMKFILDGLVGAGGREDQAKMH